MRAQIIVNALASDELGHAERVFLFVAAMLPAEYVDGKRRPGSVGMDERGWFALHYDYLAKHLHTSPKNAKKTAERLTEKGWLFKRHPGTFGRPAGWQALDVRGDKSSRITGFRGVAPYEVYAAYVRGDTVSPLTYRGADLASHAPDAGVFREPVADVQAAEEEQQWAEAVAHVDRAATQGREATA